MVVIEYMYILNIYSLPVSPFLWLPLFFNHIIMSRDELNIGLFKYSNNSNWKDFQWAQNSSEWKRFKLVQNRIHWRHLMILWLKGFKLFKWRTIYYFLLGDNFQISKIELSSSPEPFCQFQPNLINSFFLE